MIKYLVILLDDTSVSYCHYDNPSRQSSLIPIDALREGIFYAMTENLLVQFVYPEYRLPEEYEEAVETVNHVKIVPAASPYTGDVVVIGWDMVAKFAGHVPSLVVRADMAELTGGYEELCNLFDKADKVNVVITDVTSISDDGFKVYYGTLGKLSDILKERYAEGRAVQLNIVTDRMMLSAMNNCNAGSENITLAPDGRFYVCPAFYYEGLFSIGSLKDGLDIRNPQLYRLDHAPLCRNCDAYQCRRCIWLNQKTTLEVNTPSHEQCVAAHHERNASGNFLKVLKSQGYFLQCDDIKEVSYLDPFDVRNEF